MGGRIGNISKQTWLEADERTQKELLFDALEQIYNCQESYNQRIRALEDSNLKDKSLAGIMGLVGGIIGGYLRSIVKW